MYSKPQDKAFESCPSNEWVGIGIRLASVSTWRVETSLAEEIKLSLECEDQLFKWSRRVGVTMPVNANLNVLLYTTLSESRTSGIVAVRTKGHKIVLNHV